jgi:hypothetical protein
VGDLGRPVAALEPVGPDDRDDHQPLDPGPLAVGVQVSRGGGEELGRRFLLRRGAGCGVDHCLDALERLGEALAADHVDTLRTRDRDNLMALALQDLDHVPADPPGRSRDRDLDLLRHDFSFRPCRRWRRRFRSFM